MKKKRPPKFKVFSATCPKCGSKETQLDLLAAENLNRIPLTVLTSSIMPGLGTKVQMRCSVCKTKFLA
jgi:hypothetical protein